MPGSISSIFIEGVDNSLVHWPETYFDARAMAEPGTCQITLRGASTPSLGSVIRLYVNGTNVWTGFVLSVTQATWLPDKNDVKVIVSGADVNVLLDRLIVYNHKDLTLHTDGDGKYKSQTVNGIEKPIGSVPPDETVDGYLRAMLDDTDYKQVDVPLKLDCGVSQFLSATNQWGTCANPGSTLRSVFNDATAQCKPDTQGSIIWYIAADGRIVVHERDAEGGGSMSEARSLSTTRDGSNVRTEAFIFAGALDPREASKQKYLIVAHEKGGTLGGLISQYSEQLPKDDWDGPVVQARASKVVRQQGTVARLARWQQFAGGLTPGMMVSAGDSSIPIRSIRYSFPHHKAVILDCEAGFDTMDPWGLILASRRPPNRGMTSPQETVLAPQEKGKTREIPACSPFTKVEEDIIPKQASAGAANSADFQLAYAYIDGTVEVFATLSGGKSAGQSRLPRRSISVPTGVPDETHQSDDGSQQQLICYIETKPDAGLITVILPAGYYKTGEDGGLELKSGLTLTASYHYANIVPTGG